MNPELAIAFYSKAFPTTSKVMWGGQLALKSPNNVLVLFTKVDQPQSRGGSERFRSPGKGPSGNKCAIYGRRGARPARREERAYRAYASDE